MQEKISMLEVMKISSDVLIEDWRRLYAISAVTLALRDHTYKTNGTEYSIRQLGERGWDLDYPRTLRIIISNKILKTQLGTSAVRGISRGEYDFVRDVNHKWSEVQEAILSESTVDEVAMREARTWYKEMYKTEDEEKIVVVTRIIKLGVPVIPLLQRVREQGGR